MYILLYCRGVPSNLVWVATGELTISKVLRYINKKNGN